MKSIIIQGEGIWLSRSPKREQLLATLKTHRLQPLLTRVQRILADHGFEWWWPNKALETPTDVRRFVAFLDQRDPTAAAFRYPVNSKGDRSFPTDFTFGFFALASVLDAFTVALDCMETSITNV
jgi:hypothetical protein